MLKLNDYQLDLQQQDTYLCCSTLSTCKKEVSDGVFKLSPFSMIPMASCHTTPSSSSFSTPWQDTAHYFRESFQTQSLSWLFQTMFRYPHKFLVLKEQTMEVCISTCVSSTSRPQQITNTEQDLICTVLFDLWLQRSQSKVIPAYKYSWLSKHVQTKEAQTSNLEGKCTTASNPPSCFTLNRQEGRVDTEVTLCNSGNLCSIARLA